MSKKDLSKIVPGVQEAASGRYSIASSVVCLAGGLLVLSFLSAHYYQMWERSSDFESLQYRLEFLHTDNEKVRVKAMDKLEAR